MTEYALNVQHPQDIAGGRILEPGEIVDLDTDAEEHPDNQRLIAEGVLLRQGAPAKAASKKGSDQ